MRNLTMALFVLLLVGCGEERTIHRADRLFFAKLYQVEDVTYIADQKLIFLDEGKLKVSGFNFGTGDDLISIVHPSGSEGDRGKLELKTLGNRVESESVDMQVLYERGSYYNKTRKILVVLIRDEKKRF